MDIDIDVTEEFEIFFAALNEATQAKVSTIIEMLQERGASLGHPLQLGALGDNACGATRASHTAGQANIEDLLLDKRGWKTCNTVIRLRQKRTERRLNLQENVLTGRKTTKRIYRRPRAVDQQLRGLVITLLQYRIIDYEEAQAVEPATKEPLLG